MTEASIFDYLKDILFTKKNIFIDKNKDSLQPYILQRWCSMSSEDIAHIINETSNRWSILYGDKDLIYKIFVSCLPRQKHKKINYIKKVNTASDDNIACMSNVVELSQKEIKSYIKTLNHISYDTLDTVS